MLGLPSVNSRRGQFKRRDRSCRFLVGQRILLMFPQAPFPSPPPFFFAHGRMSAPFDAVTKDMYVRTMAYSAHAGEYATMTRETAYQTESFNRSSFDSWIMARFLACHPRNSTRQPAMHLSGSHRPKLRRANVPHVTYTAYGLFSTSSLPIWYVP